MIKVQLFNLKSLRPPEFFIYFGVSAGLAIGLTYIASIALLTAIEANQYSTNLCYSDLIGRFSHEMNIAIKENDLEKLEEIVNRIKSVRSTYDVTCNEVTEKWNKFN